MESIPVPSFFAVDNEHLRFSYGSRGNRYGSPVLTQTIKVHFPVQEVIVFDITNIDTSISTRYYEQELMEKYY